MSVPLRLSKWTHRFERGEITALFHSLRLGLLFFEERCRPLLEELRYGATPERLRFLVPDADEIVDELRIQEMVVPISNDDDAVLAEMQEKYVGHTSLETIFMLLTDACNLKCKYCFINGNMPEQYHTKVMSWNTARTTIDMYFANLRENNFHKSIVFYGGEPLLAFPLLNKIVMYIQNRYPKEVTGFDVDLLLITNGTRINSLIAEYLVQHPEISICISLDGFGETNDQMRIHINGRGTFSDIRAGIECLHRAGRADVNISTTIDAHNIDRLDELLALHEELGFQSVDPSYTERATESMIEYFKKARDVGLYEDRIMRKVRAIERGVLHPFDCRATGAQLAISPDGSLGVCHEGVGCKNFFFGAVSNDFRFADNPLIQEWGRRSPLSMPQCFSCPSLGLCGGGCAYSAYLRHGTIWAIDDKFCKHSLKVLKWIVWDVHDQM